MEILVGLCLVGIGIAVAIYAWLSEEFHKKYIRILLAIVSVILVCSGAFLMYESYKAGKIAMKEREARNEYIKSKIAEEYPNAIEFSTQKLLLDAQDYDGSFESEGIKYKFKEAEDLKGNKVLSIVGTNEKNPDTKIIKMNDCEE